MSTFLNDGSRRCPTAALPPRLHKALQLLSLCILSRRGVSFCPSRLQLRGSVNEFSSLAEVTSKSLFSSPNDQVVEALQSLADFHEGEWTGVATSFTVTNDVMAGVVQRKTSAPYTVSVKFGVDAKADYSLTEALTVNVGGKNGEKEKCQRRIALSNCNMDVDSVDASYSLDATLPDFPPTLAGTQKLLHFGIEHCLATSDNARSRCFAFYGADEQLSRIVVCHEERVTALAETTTTTTGETQQPIQHLLTPQDLIEMKSEVDRLVDRITGNGTQQSDKNIKVDMNNGSYISSQQKGTNPLDRLQQETVSAGGSGMTGGKSNDSLSRHLITLLELSAGTWVGDSVIRDVPMVPTSPVQQKGFGTTAGSAGRGQKQPEKVPFGSWTVGVQKMAWRWMWNFGEEIRQVIDVGRAMGAQLSDPLAKSSMSGSVCVNEGMSRRIPKDERMVYIDWEGDNVGFLCGSVSIQVPQYLKFDQTRRVRPFYTEFAVYQSAKADLSNTADDSSDDAAQLPEVICSKISRVYNYEGKLKQGVTSFFTLQRFGIEGESDEL